MGVRVRYAPSPTGHLHIGGARTALFNYLFARNQGGVFILRIEDTDLERNVSAAAEEFASGLDWLGVQWDEGIFRGGDHGPYLCTERLHIYPQYVEMLREAGMAYDCYCTEEELRKERDALVAAGKMPQYSGRCRHLSEAEKEAFRSEGRAPVVRFRIPDGHTVRFRDRVRGEMEFETRGIGGDFVIVKSNGVPTYNFACVVDDRLMEITHVIRGEEHLSNTPRQLLLYEAFGWEPPEFAHVSLILGPDGRKLSKRDESIVQFVDQYRELGYLPEALFNFLALLGWSPEGEEEIFSREELIQAFRLDRVSKSGAFFDSTRLSWMNGHYLKQKPAADLIGMVRPHLSAFSGSAPWTRDDAWVEEWISLFKDQVTCLSELPEAGEVFLRDLAPDSDARFVLQEGAFASFAHALYERLKNLDPWDLAGVKRALKEVQAASGFKGKDFFMPVRAAVTGRTHGPDLNRSVVLMGRDRVLSRIARSLAMVSEVR